MSNPSLPSFQLIDCRFKYEFDGGHIGEEVLLINEPEEIQERFFGDKMVIEHHMRENTIFVFHCEFS